MATNFAVVWDELHQHFGSLSRQTPLIPIFEGDTTSRKYALSSKVIDLIHDTDQLEKIVPARYYELLGIPERFANGAYARTTVRLYYEANYFDATRCDSNCRPYTVRNTLSQRSTSLFAADLLNNGVGILRPVRASSTGFLAFIGKPVEKLMPKGTKIYGNVIAKTHLDSENNEQYHSEDWESTNILYGDMYGELQQIQDRQKDKRFLKKVCEALKHLPHNLQYIGEELQYLYQEHLHCQQLWDNPPQSENELTERVNYILNHCTLDKNPRLELKLHPKYNGANIYLEA